MQGARSTRTSDGLVLALSAASSASAPLSSQVMESQTRMVVGGGGVSPFLHDVEMGIEGGNFVGCGLRQTHLLAQRLQMRCRDKMIAILNQVQKFDQ